MDSNLAKIKDFIYEVRGHKVMFDNNLAALYAVETKVLNQAVKRNIDRFPSDFMFQLTGDEWLALRSQFVTSIKGGRQYLPYAFTEQGVAMLSSVLKSSHAAQVNINIMRAFVAMRRLALEQSSNANEIKELKQMLMLHIDYTDSKMEKQDRKIIEILRILDNLIEHPKPKRKIGFITEQNDEHETTEK